MMHGFTENYIKVEIPYDHSLVNENPAGHTGRLERGQNGVSSKDYRINDLSVTFGLIQK